MLESALGRICSASGEADCGVALPGSSLSYTSLALMQLYIAYTMMEYNGIA